MDVGEWRHPPGSSRRVRGPQRYPHVTNPYALLSSHSPPPRLGFWAHLPEELLASKSRFWGELHLRQMEPNFHLGNSKNLTCMGHTHRRLHELLFPCLVPASTVTGMDVLSVSDNTRVLCTPTLGSRVLTLQACSRQRTPC